MILSKSQDIFVKKPYPTNDKKPKDIPERAVKKKVVRIKLPEEEEEEPEEVTGQLVHNLKNQKNQKKLLIL